MLLYHPEFVSSLKCMVFAILCSAYLGLFAGSNCGSTGHRCCGPIGVGALIEPTCHNASNEAAVSTVSCHAYL